MKLEISVTANINLAHKDPQGYKSRNIFSSWRVNGIDSSFGWSFTAASGWSCQRTTHASSQSTTQRSSLMDDLQALDVASECIFNLHESRLNRPLTESQRLVEPLVAPQHASTTSGNAPARLP